jgi:hypothetical protein
VDVVNATVAVFDRSIAISRSGLRLASKGWKLAVRKCHVDTV